MKKKPTALLTALFIIISAGLASAASLKLSMLPRYSSDEISRRITPLSLFINKQLGIPVEPVIKTDFTAYEKSLKNNEIDIGYENPYIYALVSGTHEVLAMAIKGKDGERFRGIIITRTDSPIVSLADLKNRKISVVGRTSAGGYLSQKLSLKRAGIDLEKDCHVVEAVENKQENVLLSVYLGEVEAGFIRESALNKADKFVPRSQIKVIKRSTWLPNWALSVRKSLPPAQKKAIRNALISLKKDSNVLKALKIDKFRVALDAEYDKVREAAGLPIPQR